MGERLIMVVNRDVLFEKDHFEGFRSKSEVDYESRILNNYIYLERTLAEKDYSHKQPISYSIIVNPLLKKVFVYQRALKDSLYKEKRLQGKWSWGVGGHINKLDIKKGNPINESMLRELNEEVEIKGDIESNILGYVNSDKDDVGRVHFGILHIIKTNSNNVFPKDSEISQGEFKSIEELEKICYSMDYSVEEWSKISLEPLKKYFSSI